MAIQGERFNLDLSSEINDDVQPSTTMNLIRDVTENFPSTLPEPPRAPTQTSTTTGFPAHKKRITKISAFKRAAQAAQGGRGKTLTDSQFKNQSRDDAPRLDDAPRTDVTPGADNDKAQEEDFEALERQRIDQENRRRLAAMSPEDIERERQELLATLSPSLVERLMKRADARIGDAAHVTTVATSSSTQAIAEAPSSSSSRKDGKTTVEESRDIVETPHDDANDDYDDDDNDDDDDIDDKKFDPDAAPLIPPPDLVPASSSKLPPLPPIHFPTRPSQPPILDPAAPDFLETLHEKYYPDLPHDPSKLAWMAPLPTDDDDDPPPNPTTTTTTNPNPNPNTTPKIPKSSYSPHLPSLPASALRFNFRGELLPPRQARQVPVTAGLHHHSDAPEAGGYAVPELARLARSVFPAQRCVAFQTLGRILYRLGKGYFGDEGSEIVMGLWRCVEEGRVLEVLQREAAAGIERGVEGEQGEGVGIVGEGEWEEGGRGGRGGEEGGGQGYHRSAQTLAVEALWNWQRGGGKRWKAQ